MALLPDRLRGFAGLIADAGNIRVESFPCGAAVVKPGVVVGTTSGAVGPGAGTKVRGIAVHSHTIVNLPGTPLASQGYQQYDAVSVMASGLIWALCNSGTVTEDGQVYFAADGTVSSTNTDTAIPRARFRSAKVAGPDSTSIAIVQLDAPNI